VSERAGIVWPVIVTDAVSAQVAELRSAVLIEVRQ
jgi:hypothetical protein